MSTIDQDLDARLSADNPSDDDKKFEKAREVKDALAELGEANGEFAEFCRDYLFAGERKLKGADAQRRDTLVGDLEDRELGPITIDGCTVSCPASHTIHITQNGKTHDYVFYGNSQALWLDGYPNGTTINLKDYKPASMMGGVDGKRFRVATQEDYEQRQRDYEDAKTANAQKKASRTRLQKLFDWLKPGEDFPTAPGSPEETPELYDSAISAAQEAQEVLETLKNVFEKLADPAKAKELPRRLQGMLESLDAMEKRDQQVRSVAQRAKEDGSFDRVMELVDQEDPSARAKIERILEDEPREGEQ